MPESPTAINELGLHQQNGRLSTVTNLLMMGHAEERAAAIWQCMVRLRTSPWVLQPSDWFIPHGTRAD